MWGDWRGDFSRGFRSGRTRRWREEGADFVASREIRGDVDTWNEDDSKTIVNDYARRDDSPIEDSTGEDSPTETSPPSKIDTLWEDDNKTTVVAAEQHDSRTIADSPVKKSPTNTPLLNWADEVNDSCQDNRKTPVKEIKAHEDPVSDSPAPETVTDVSVPSPIEASSPTWAEVAASPVKSQSNGPNCERNWGDVSGKSWEWDRNWRG